jgi:predicted aminopeptidase
VPAVNHLAAPVSRGPACRLRVVGSTVLGSVAPVRRAHRWSALGLAAGALALIAAVAGCSTVGYGAQAVAGGAGILLRRQPIDRVLGSGRLDEERARKLAGVAAIRDFAERELALPDDGSYRSYVALGRDVVVWNVVAAPELAIEPRVWCFPVAGCVSYRGYFRERAARRSAARLAARGDDVAVGGALAYSTLGWFADPVFDTFLALPDRELAALLFHELAHRVVYVADDTAFNESYAGAVEELGLELWLAVRGDPEEIAAARRERAEERRFVELRLAARAELAVLYASALDDDAKRTGKRRILEALVAEHRRLRAAGELGPRWDGWLARAPNNADLATLADYTLWLPAFRSLFAASGGFAHFHDAVRELAALAPSARRDRLEALGGRAGSAG